MKLHIIFFLLTIGFLLAACNNEAPMNPNTPQVNERANTVAEPDPIITDDRNEVERAADEVKEAADGIEDAANSVDEAKDALEGIPQ